MQDYRGNRALRITGTPAVIQFIASASIRRSDACMLALLIDRDLYLVGCDAIEDLCDDQVRARTIRLILEAKSLAARGIILVAERTPEESALRETDQRFYRDLRNCSAEQDLEVLDLININGRAVTHTRPVHAHSTAFADNLAVSAPFPTLWG